MGSIIVEVQATVISFQLQVAGEVADYGEDAPQRDELEGRLRVELSCSLPECLLELIVKAAGSVALEVKLTVPEGGAGARDGAAIAAEVTAAATDMATRPIDELIASLGVQLLALPSTPTVTNDVPALIATAPPPPSVPPSATTITHTIKLNAGWTWISSPLFSGHPNDDLFFSGLASQRDIVKDQFSFTNYVPGYGWFGGLNSLSPSTFYKMRFSAGGDLVITGTEADPSGTVYPLNKGWSWIGWPSMTTQPVSVIDDAFEDISKLTTQTERIKSQFKFTSWVPGWGWFGDLLTFEPGQGYMIKLSQANRLVDFGVIRTAGRERKLESVQISQPERVVNSGPWSLKPDAFESSMCVVAVVVIDGVVAEGGVLAAFVDDQLIGVASPSSYTAPVGPFKAYKSYNLMIYGHVETEGAMVAFQYRHANGDVSMLAPGARFTKNDFLGSVVDPFVIVHTTIPHPMPSTTRLVAASAS